jgi:hypothetical protein
MPSTYTTNNGIELIGTGEQSGTWGETTNTNLNLVDASLDGHTTITLVSAGTSGSPNSLPISDGSASNGRNRALIFTDGGDLGDTVYVQLTPNDAKKIIFVRNSLSGSRNLILFQGTYSASNDFVLAAGKDAIVKFDGGGSGAIASAVLENLALDAATITTISNTTLNTATVNATTVDTTSIEVTNVKAKDGTASATIANSTGVMTIASSVLTTTDINGGTIDGATIGGSSAAAGTFTTATATTGNITTVNATTVDTTNIEVTTLKAKDGTSAGSIADSTGVVTLASSVLTTTDINGGTIDGTVIGGTSAAAGTFTTVTGTSFVSSGNMTFGDNDRAIFGAGSDLQIYHDGSNTYIDESAGVGNLIIKGANVQFKTPTDETYLAFSNNGAVTAYYDNAFKLATTATGIDVTGTVTADALTVDGVGVISANSASDALRITQTGAGNAILVEDSANPDSTPFVVTSTGDVGIGTSSPSEKLSVEYSGDVAIEVKSTGTGDADASVIIDAADTGEAVLEFRQDGVTKASIEWFSEGSPDFNFRTVSGTNGVFDFQPNDTLAMRIDASGNVGIGTDAPAAALHVNSGTTNLAGLFESTDAGATITLIDNSTTGGSVAEQGLNTVGDQLEIRAVDNLAFETAVTERMRIDADGRVGVGYAPTITKFGVSSTGTDAWEYIAVRNTTSGEYTGIGFDGNDTTSNFIISRQDTGGRNIAISDTGNVYLNPDQDNVGIGLPTTETPAARLHVNGNSLIEDIDAGSAVGPTFFLRRTSASPADDDYLGEIRFQGTNSAADNTVNYARIIAQALDVTDGTEDGALTFWTTQNGTSSMKMELINTGTLALNGGSATPGGTSLNTLGILYLYRNSSTASTFAQSITSDWGAVGREVYRVRADGNVLNYNNSYGALSDAKLKENVSDATPKLEDLCKLRVVNFNYIGDENKQLGLIAQEVEQVFPKLVDENPDTDADGNETGDVTKSVKYSILVPMLVKALQEQQDMISALEARLTALESK